jgi:23S rRNA pseudouridine955/2504/2580 synthase/23S rRNA pseudouridine1911/1915/1917 synthase
MAKHMKNKSLDLIFEDDDIIVLSKASGMFSIPDRWKKDAPNLYTILNDKYGKIFTVHRLDRDTSGVMIFAKNAEAHKHLNQQFQEHTIKKLYHVVVAGNVPQDEIKIDIPLMENPSKPGITMPTMRGKESLTIMRIMEKYSGATLVECELVTGRHHQIRVHCAAIGHPLLVDDLYGTATEFFISSIKRKFKLKKQTDEKPIISRITMHAKSIEFKHPKTNEIVSFVSEYPKDFRALLQVLKKYSALPEYYNKPSKFQFE